MPGPYATVGARLVERGYAAIPIMPGTKRPGQRRGGEWIGINDWRDRFSRRLPSSFEIGHWSSTDAGVCVVAGPASRHLVAIDIDTDRPEIDAAIRAVLPPTTVRKAGQKGETLFYRCEDLALFNGSTQSPSFNVDSKRVCDVIGPGRQTVLPPTIHPDTREPYRWTGPDALEDVDPGELPELPADISERIAAALKPFGFEADRQPINGVGDADSPHRMLNETALQRLDAWVPQLGLYRCRKTARGYEAVATWRPSSTGRPDQQRKLNLKIVPDGIRDFGAGQGYTPIDLVIAAHACDLDTAFKFLTGALGWSQETITIEHVPAIPAEQSAPLVRPDPLAGLTHVPGVVGDLIDWITATARRPNRVLALGVALTVVGTLIGRRVAGPTRSGTHLYVVTLSPTGAGKQHPLSCLMRLMRAAKAAPQHVGPSEFISMPAVINFLMRQPLSLCPQDEFGAFLRRVNARHASGFESAISKTLRSMWGCSFEAFVTPEWAGRRAEVISAPAVSICGFSVQHEFYEALQGEDVTNGFLNRFLIVSSGVRAPETTPAQEPGVVPASLTCALDSLYNWDGSQLGTARLNDPGLDPTPDVLPWTSEAAQKVYTDLARHIEAEMDAKPVLEPFIARTAEIALRIATIRAAGRWGQGATVDVSDMEWGRDVALASATTVSGDAAANMVVEMSAGRMGAKVLEIVTRGGRVSRRDALRALGRSVKKVQDFDDVVRVLAESGQIEISKSIPAAGGTPTIWYRPLD